MKTVILISNGKLKYVATTMSDGHVILVEDGKKSTLEFDSVDLNDKAIREITNQWVNDAKEDEKNRHDKIEKLFLLESIGNFLCDDDLLAAWDRIEKAMDNGEGQKYASEICELVDTNEYDSVRNIYNEITAHKANLWAVYKRVQEI